MKALISTLALLLLIQPFGAWAGDFMTGYTTANLLNQVNKNRASSSTSVVSFTKEESSEGTSALSDAYFIDSEYPLSEQLEILEYQREEISNSGWEFRKVAKLILYKNLRKVWSNIGLAQENDQTSEVSIEKKEFNNIIIKSFMKELITAKTSLRFSFLPGEDQKNNLSEILEIQVGLYSYNYTKRRFRNENYFITCNRRNLCRKDKLKVITEIRAEEHKFFNLRRRLVLLSEQNSGLELELINEYNEAIERIRESGREYLVRKEELTASTKTYVLDQLGYATIEFSNLVRFGEKIEIE